MAVDTLAAMLDNLIVKYKDTQILYVAGDFNMPDIDWTVIA